MRLSIITKTKHDIFSDHFDVCVYTKRKFLSKEILGYEIIVYSTSMSKREFVICRVPTPELANKICNKLWSGIKTQNEYVEIDLREMLKIKEKYD